MNVFLTQRLWAVVLTVLIPSQSVLASISESNVWAERRQSLSSPRTPIASLQQNLLKQLPAVGAAPSRPSTWAGVSGNRSSFPQDLQTILSAIPLNHASIQDVHVGKSAQKAPIVLVQDLHLNAEAQMNMAAVLQSLINHANVGTVGIEGAFDPFDFSGLRALTDEQRRRDIGEAFVNKNFMAAPSYVGLTSPGELPLFVGVDDLESYKSNVRAYLSSRTRKDNVTRALHTKKKRLDELKREHFSAPLFAFDGARTAYLDGTIGLGVYVQKLAAFKTQSDFVIDQFLEALSIESALNFAQVDQERRIVIEKLSARLTDEEMSNLLAQSMAYRMGKIGFGAYYQDLKRLCSAKGVSLKQTPAFDDYVRYVLLSDGIKPEKLFASVEMLEKKVLSALRPGEPAKKLLDTSVHVSLSQKLVEFSLTPKEWDRYKSGRGDERLSPFEQFYEQADIRSHKMIGQLLAQNSAGARILTVGGFHTPQIADLLRQRNIPFVIVSPKVTKIEAAAGSSYLSIFAQEKMALEKLFTGEKLFINPAMVAGVGGTKTTGALARERTNLLREVLPRIPSARSFEYQQGSRYTPGRLFLKGKELELIGHGKWNAVFRLGNGLVMRIRKVPFFNFSGSDEPARKDAAQLFSQYRQLAEQGHISARPVRHGVINGGEYTIMEEIVPASNVSPESAFIMHRDLMYRLIKNGWKAWDFGPHNILLGKTQSMATDQAMLADLDRMKRTTDNLEELASWYLEQMDLLNDDWATTGYGDRLESFLADIKREGRLPVELDPDLEPGDAKLLDTVGAREFPETLRFWTFVRTHFMDRSVPKTMKNFIGISAGTSFVWAAMIGGALLAALGAGSIGRAAWLFNVRAHNLINPILTRLGFPPLTLPPKDRPSQATTNRMVDLLSRSSLSMSKKEKLYAALGHTIKTAAEMGRRIRRMGGKLWQYTDPREENYRNMGLLRGDQKTGYELNVHWTPQHAELPESERSVQGVWEKQGTYLDAIDEAGLFLRHLHNPNLIGLGDSVPAEFAHLNTLSSEDLLKHISEKGFNTWARPFSNTNVVTFRRNENQRLRQVRAHDTATPSPVLGEVIQVPQETLTLTPLLEGITARALISTHFAMCLAVTIQAKDKSNNGDVRDLIGLGHFHPVGAETVIEDIVSVLADLRLSDVDVSVNFREDYPLDPVSVAKIRENAARRGIEFSLTPRAREIHLDVLQTAKGAFARQKDHSRSAETPDIKISPLPWNAPIGEKYVWDINAVERMIERFLSKLRDDGPIPVHTVTQAEVNQFVQDLLEKNRAASFPPFTGQFIGRARAHLTSRIFNAVFEEFQAQNGFGNRKISLYLFGSLVRGEAAANSDIDYLLIPDNPDDTAELGRNNIELTTQLSALGFNPNGHVLRPEWVDDLRDVKTMKRVDIRTYQEMVPVVETEKSKALFQSFKHQFTPSTRDEIHRALLKDVSFALRSVDKFSRDASAELDLKPFLTGIYIFASAYRLKNNLHPRLDVIEILRSIAGKDISNDEAGLLIAWYDRLLMLRQQGTMVTRELTEEYRRDVTPLLVNQPAYFNQVVRHLISISQHGLVSGDQVESLQTSAVRGNDRNLTLGGHVFVVEADIANESQFQKFPAEIAASYSEYIQRRTRHLLYLSDIQRSPVGIMFERKTPNFLAELDAVGVAEMERRLNSGAVILSSEEWSVEEFKEIEADGGQNFYRGGGLATSRTSIHPNKIEAIFIPEALFDQISNQLPSPLLDKVIRVAGQTTLQDLFGIRPDKGVINVPDWESAVQKYLMGKRNGPSRTYVAHGTRIQTMREFESGSQTQRPRLGLIFGATGKPWLDNVVIPMAEEAVFTGIPLLMGSWPLFLVSRIVFVLAHRGRQGLAPAIISASVFALTTGIFGFDFANLTSTEMTQFLGVASFLHMTVNAADGPHRKQSRSAASFAPIVEPVNPRHHNGLTLPQRKTLVDRVQKLAVLRHGRTSAYAAQSRFFPEYLAVGDSDLMRDTIYFYYDRFGANRFLRFFAKHIPFTKTRYAWLTYRMIQRKPNSALVEEIKGLEQSIKTALDEDRLNSQSVLKAYIAFYLYLNKLASDDPDLSMYVQIIKSNITRDAPKDVQNFTASNDFSHETSVLNNENGDPVSVNPSVLREAAADVAALVQSNQDILAIADAKHMNTIVEAIQTNLAVPDGERARMEEGARSLANILVAIADNQPGLAVTQIQGMVNLNVGDARSRLTAPFIQQWDRWSVQPEFIVMLRNEIQGRITSESLTATDLMAVVLRSIGFSETERLKLLSGVRADQPVVFVMKGKEDASVILAAVLQHGLHRPTRFLVKNDAATLTHYRMMANALNRLGGTVHVVAYQSDEEAGLDGASAFHPGEIASSLLPDSSGPENVVFVLDNGITYSGELKNVIFLAALIPVEMRPFLKDFERIMRQVLIAA